MPVPSTFSGESSRLTLLPMYLKSLGSLSFGSAGGVIFEAASSRLARELAAMEKTDEPAALGKILDVLRQHAPQYYDSAEVA